MEIGGDMCTDFENRALSLEPTKKKLRFYAQDILFSSTTAENI